MPITRTSSGQAGRRRCRSVRSNAWSGEERWSSCRQSFVRLRSCGSAILRCPSASSPRDAVPLRRSLRRNDALRASFGSPACRARHECAILEFAAGLCSSGGGFRPRPSSRSGARFNWRGRSSSELLLRPAASIPPLRSCRLSAAGAEDDERAARLAGGAFRICLGTDADRVEVLPGSKPPRGEAHEARPVCVEPTGGG
jgi:hypothetical protein